MPFVVTGQAPITAVLILLCSTCTEYYEALLGWNTRSRCADQICYPYARLTYWRRECLCHRPLGVLLFWYGDGEYVKNSVLWKCIHPAGPLDWCQRPHVHRKPRGRRKSVSPFWSTFWGVVPLLSSALNIMYWCFIHGPTRMPKSLAGFVARVVSRTEWVLLSSLAVCSLLSDALSTDRWCQVTWSATVVWL